MAQPLRLQGQYWDQEIGLSYNRYRYFDPHICSFISQDPIGLTGGENVYGFAPNVWGWIDPLGLWGFAIDFGGSYGTGDGDQYTDAGGAGSGIYIGGRDTGRPDVRGGYAEIGAFTYQEYGKTWGAHLGLGMNFTHYKIDASNFFKGDLNYKGFTFLFYSYREFYDADGTKVGWTISLFGKGIGFSEDEGLSRGWSCAAQ